MTTSISEHEKLFDEICSKLNQLSGTSNEPQDAKAERQQPMVDQNTPTKYEKMQVQMQKFQHEMLESHEELREKMRLFEHSGSVQVEVSQQMRNLTDQLAQERANNSKLSADLAKSLELCLQLQLEIQGLKARAMQIQNEEKKYSQALLEKNRAIQRDFELLSAMKEEITIELTKAKSAFTFEQEKWEEQHQILEKQIDEGNEHRRELMSLNENLEKRVHEKEGMIENLRHEIDDLSISFQKVEGSAQKQSEVMKDLMSVAESKIVEMKLALDKKQMESQDYYNHLQQSLTQVSVLKQENLALKDYINKLNVYHQQAQQYQAQQNHQQQQGLVGSAVSGPVLEA